MEKLFKEDLSFPYRIFNENGLHPSYSSPAAEKKGAPETRGPTAFHHLPPDVT